MECSLWEIASHIQEITVSMCGKSVSLYLYSVQCMIAFSLGAFTADSPPVIFLDMMQEAPVGDRSEQEKYDWGVQISMPSSTAILLLILIGDTEMTYGDKSTFTVYVVVYFFIIFLFIYILWGGEEALEFAHFQCYVHSVFFGPSVFQCAM